MIVDHLKILSSCRENALESKLLFCGFSGSAQAPWNDLHDANCKLGVKTSELPAIHEVCVGGTRQLDLPDTREAGVWFSRRARNLVVSGQLTKPELRCLWKARILT